MMAGVVWWSVAAAAAVATQAPERTVQQDFDAATALDAAPDAGPALAAWEALGKRVRPGSRSAAIVLVRKGDALFRLGRMEEASAALQAGLAALPASDATLRQDRSRAALLLGALSRETLDYAGAARRFTEAEALADEPGDKLSVLVSLAQVQTFVDPAAAGRTLARIDTLAAPMKLNASDKAIIARRHATLMLNTGDIGGAKTQASYAVNALGGLTDRTKLDDVPARADAALAYLLAGDRDKAREYMAMTGAGRLSKGEFNPAAEMQPPDCGGEAGLKPADVAVVEFTIGADGRVTGVQPIYAAGGGGVALEFARAVRRWSWPVKDVAAIPPFFRYGVRVEMRCSTAFARPSIADSMDARLEQWLVDQGVPAPPVAEDGDAAAVEGQRKALAAAATHSPDSLETLGAAYRLASNRVVPREESAALYARAAAIAVKKDAPPLARLALDLPSRTRALVDEWRDGAFARVATPLSREPGYAADPQAQAAIALMTADQLHGKRDDAALALLRPVGADARLAASDPFRVGALIRIASIEQRRGAADAARTTFAATGLAADQCAILDAPPKMTSMPGSEAFPMEAMRWGFEGWTMLQYDITASGRTGNARTLLSYPPFIFSQAGTDFAGRARFAKTFRPDGQLGCGGTISRIVFKMPG
ncbi:hypothetical protein Q5H91_02280 [Sphingomonas sp. KR1UV-12]|uniref:TonB C-terminal domain-containing protein n=1 Tax=Sphingomonas aurea TaxID=3063994 RepID=A0ABT9EGD3_9SPHN|nr:hypothetical protein [Sphingomonas sp. KR1UV-12]MDP1026025.1 hypothetical protein [Sphingomonas sp. KR1UV-12]